jgi:hypothetical protein
MVIYDEAENCSFASLVRNFEVLPFYCIAHLNSINSNCVYLFSYFLSIGLIQYIILSIR